MEEKDIQSEEVQDNAENAAPMNSNMILGIVGVIAVVGIAAFFLMKQSSGALSTQPVASAAPTPMVDNPTIDANKGMTASDSGTTLANGSAKQIAMEAGSFYFKPAVLTAKKGEKIQIVFTSKDMMHDFNIDELDVHSAIVNSGNTKTVEFTPTKTGTFEFYCGVGNHRQKGQVGKITVTE